MEHKCQELLNTKSTYDRGSSAKGIDFPSLKVDLKVTSIRKPQSSSPFTSARRKVRGLGYSLLVFVYQKTDDNLKRVAKLQILHTTTSSPSYRALPRCLRSNIPPARSLYCYEG